MGVAANLHAYWDTGVVEALGGSADAIAASLSAQISPSAARAWSGGDPWSWAMESLRLSMKDAYALPSRPICNDPETVA